MQTQQTCSIWKTGAMTHALGGKMYNISGTFQHFLKNGQNIISLIILGTMAGCEFNIWQCSEERRCFPSNINYFTVYMRFQGRLAGTRRYLIPSKTMDPEALVAWWEQVCKSKKKQVGAWWKSRALFSTKDRVGPVYTLQQQTYCPILKHKGDWVMQRSSHAQRN